MKHRRLSSSVGDGSVAAAPKDAAQAHTAQALASSLQRIAGLHADLAAAYHDLAQDLETGLDVLVEASLYAHMPARQPQPEFLTADDVAALLQVSARTVWRRASEGRLPAPIRVSPGRVRWRRSDLDEALNQEPGS